MAWADDLQAILHAEIGDDYAFKPMKKGVGVYCEKCQRMIVEDEERFVEALDEVEDHEKAMHR